VVTIFWVHEEIKRRLHPDNAQNLPSSCPLSTDAEINICECEMLPIGLHEPGTWFLTLGKNTEHSSPNIITIIKSRKMTWAGHAARMG
jgi:hypothetical protein